MRNWLTVISIFKTNFTIYVTVIFGKPKSFLIHNTHCKVKLTHFLINPKFRRTAFSILKLILSNYISKITCNFFRISMELKLRSHLTIRHRIASITFRIRFTNSRSTHRPIHSWFKEIRIYISFWIRSCKFKDISISIRTFT